MNLHVCMCGCECGSFLFSLLPEIVILIRLWSCYTIAVMNFCWTYRPWRETAIINSHTKPHTSTHIHTQEHKHAHIHTHSHIYIVWLMTKFTLFVLVRRSVSSSEFLLYLLHPSLYVLQEFRIWTSESKYCHPKQMRTIIRQM